MQREVGGYTWQHSQQQEYLCASEDTHSQSMTMLCRPHFLQDRHNRTSEIVSHVHVIYGVESLDSKKYSVSHNIYNIKLDHL